MDLPLSFVIAEGNDRIHNPVDSRKLADLGEALRLTPGSRLLDLASGSGEMLCTWARDFGLRGTGVDISTAFTASAKARAAELGVADRCEFVHGDAAGYVASEPVDIAACIGATWIGGGTAGTVALLEQSLRPGGLMLIGECYWRQDPPDEATVKGCYIESRASLFSLAGLIDHFDELGYDVVEMVLADPDSWDRYAAPHWLNIRTWLDEHPGHELADEMRHKLQVDRVNHVRYQRDYLGWGIFALMKR
ncbi:methyltransferase domain-containing protein [Glycomyces sp. NPDC021274]|uniref:SAM-dependent methyltransferase n=1 Tax=Glycomyces sp. NPDC021274 TaxID=3155120 RepID=UPI00341155F2